MLFIFAGKFLPLYGQVLQKISQKANGFSRWMNAVGLGIINYYLCFYMRIDTSLSEEERKKVKKSIQTRGV